jgi:hypothetical protein
VNLADGAPALCCVELTYVEDRRRVTRWELYGRAGVLLEECGIRLSGGARAWGRPPD